MIKLKKRRAKQIKSFKVDGTFESLYAAERFAKDNGYNYGSLCGNNPVALVKGDYDLPQKWKNFNRLEKNMAHGVMLSTDFREGEVTVVFYE